MVAKKASSLEHDLTKHQSSLLVQYIVNNRCECVFDVSLYLSHLVKQFILFCFVGFDFFLFDVSIYFHGIIYIIKGQHIFVYSQSLLDLLFFS